ncbi:histidine kinase [Variovorax sp. J22G21]|uniref:sensor histidine kinase n=1 Tax=Variovorax fucosicus TaxID=3053517 RepID=UPI0025760B35|nr:MULTISPECIES: histidine kinase [unclassified Variovorax]MDM0040156.1 histidine kinase [Variovorax sp. J22R193]MDM0058276.1 histidine kinase [Variovorax sp. J22G47]MDM0061529.1 histidine kinase [Variovorax sp. J22G21]
MRNPSILSATPVAPSSAGAPAKSRTPARPGVALFDACQVGTVLRAVLFVEAVVAVATMFQAPSPSEWLGLAATVTGGALPATLLWLVLACAMKKPLARLPRVAQYAAGVLLGVLTGLYGCGLLRLTGVLATGPWLASALAGALFAGVAMVALVLRAQGRTPAATTARLEELQARIRPHFLFNTLNSAIALVREEPAKAETMLEDLSELFRQALADPRDSVTLADEIGLAERYLAIEQVRFGDRLRIRWQLDPAASGARLPPLLLQPLVENAVKHGVEPSPDGAKLRIRTERRGSMVVIEVVNSLPPLRWADEPLPRGHGIALANVRDRLRLLHDMQAQFRAGIDQGSYRVRIDIPAES